ncbi:MAG: rane protein of unknown function [Candidatus Saccharibacteria bacterium]|nr:rane protein of unknown function [Candidatus Saccharibacteria bacterium]
MSNDSSNQSHVPWNPWLGVGSAIGIFFIAQFLAAIPVGIVYSLTGGSLNNIGDIANNIGLQFLTILVIEALIVGAICLFLRFYKTSLAVIGLRRPRWSDLAYALAAIPFYFGLYLVTVAVVTAFVPELNVNQQQEIGFNNPSGALQLSLTFLALVVLPPIAEEILFRGFIYSSLKKGLPIAGAVVVTSGLFAIAHLPAGGEAGPLYIAAIDTFVLSLVLIYLREKTGGLWSSMTLHAIKNGVAFAALFILHVR